MLSTQLPHVATAISPPESLKPLIASTFNTSTLSFYLNGTHLVLENADPGATLLDWIRSQRGLRGTKLGCGTGGCGACTVVVQQLRGGKVEHLCVNACLAPLISVEGKHVITIEALGTISNPHPLQERIAKLHGSQCGFCTPGIVMCLYALLRNAYNPVTKSYRLTAGMVELEGALDGNLCRCTGYKPILDAAKSFVREDLGGVVEEGPEQEGAEDEVYATTAPGSCGRPGGCCKDEVPSPISSSDEESTGTNLTEPPETCGRSNCCKLPVGSSKPEIETEVLSKTSAFSFPQFNFKSYEPRTEIIFPPKLRKHVQHPICLGDSKRIWLRPTSLAQLLEIKNVFPSANMVAGGSGLNHGDLEYAVSVYIGDIEELKSFSVDEEAGEVVIGGSTTLTVVEQECLEWHKKLGKRGLVLGVIGKLLRRIGGRQIRNIATSAGGIIAASANSDLNPLFVASGTILTAQSVSQGSFAIPMVEFFLDSGSTALPPDAVITKLTIPLNMENERGVIRAYKQAKRRRGDFAIVSASLRVVLDDAGLVKDISLAYGGVAAATVTAKHTQEVLMGKRWFDKDVLELAMNSMEKDFSLPFSVSGGMPTFKKTLAFSFFLRFWHEAAAELNLATVDEKVDRDIISEINRGISSGIRDDENPYEQRVVGKQIPHLSGLKQATGEAEFIDDMPKFDGELYGGLVLSKRAHAKLLKVNFTPALAVPGVHGFVDHHDIPEDRALYGAMSRDERFLAKDVVEFHGQPIGMVYAETKEIAQMAAKLVHVEYEDLPAILTISDAIKAESFHDFTNRVKRGTPPADAFKNCDHIFEGVTKMGGQEHFYLETNTALVNPKPEDGEMEVWSSTQNIMETQTFVAQITGVPNSRIVAKVKRLGGAFGGKESRSVQLACILALAAKKCGRPMRCMLTRDEDMTTTGQRNPFQTHWKVGVSKDGMLQVLDADLYNNAGFSLDMSAAVMGRALTHIDNTYWIPHVDVRGHVCKTNIHSNTAFRGFGAPQGMYTAECIMSEVADALGISVDDFRDRNLYREGQLTPFLQPLHDWHIPQIIKQLREESDYDRRVKEVEEFNKTHTWKKRGICCVPTKFGLSFATAIHLNQGGALVHIYEDGSVLLAHGGTEMGQGLYTKMCQIAAQELGVPMDSIFTSETASNVVANTSPTAASSGSDLNGMAVQDACQKLNARLEPFREKLGRDAPMKLLAKKAYRDRVNLSANGFYKMPEVGYIWGNYIDPLPMYSYFTQGAAISEVELDVVTGDHLVLRTDVKMDVGKSINPAIDYGQIEGGFVQGQGLFTTEETLWLSGDGQLYTRGPSTYKIPGFADIPQDFRASLLKGVQWPNLRTIQSSKGIGEPSLFLGATVLFALRDAVKAAREELAVEEVKKEILTLDSPATPERLRLAIGDRIVKWATVEAAAGEKGYFFEAQA